MRIEFDAANDTELSAVFVMLAVLRGGDLSLPTIGDLDFDDSEISDVRVERDTEPMVPVPGAESLPPPPPPTLAPVAAPPPPVATVPAAPSPAATGVELDADGLPWDNRIHSTPASKKKDGRWRGKRGLDDATRQTVTAELRATMGAPAPAAPPVPPPMFEESAPGVPLPPTAPAPDVSAATAFGAEGAASATSSPPPPPPAAPDPNAPATDFAGLMRKITSLQSSGKMTVADSMQIAQSLGITGVRDLMHRPDLIPSFDALLPAGA